MVGTTRPQPKIEYIHRCVHVVKAHQAWTIKCCSKRKTESSLDRLKGQIRKTLIDQADFYLFSKGYLARNCAASTIFVNASMSSFPPRPPPHVHFAPFGMTAVCGVWAGLVRCMRV